MKSGTPHIVYQLNVGERLMFRAALHFQQVSIGMFKYENI